MKSNGYEVRRWPVGEPVFMKPGIYAINVGFDPPHSYIPGKGSINFSHNGAGEPIPENGNGKTRFVYVDCRNPEPEDWRVLFIPEEAIE